METFLLILIFYTAQGHPTIVEGWHPMAIPSLERCESGKQNIQDYIDQAGLPERFIEYSVHCVKKEM